ncbi:unnamed protein product [Brassicogethes aeneus]|uniref:Ubiquitin-like domain-containing protein n=1 Tax=Brassicogethes aeneus TaxID=1431903 RepID=A0A9P0AX20_BRAAE|nr:unnamed protein product [Brassicogethes aeneus]
MSHKHSQQLQLTLPEKTCSSPEALHDVTGAHSHASPLHPSLPQSHVPWFSHTAKGSSIDKFIGFFPTADTDFDIQTDNTGNDRRISFNLKGTKDFGSFVVGAGRKALLKTVTDNGRHFHFTSQLGEKGKEVVAANAARSNITYEESSEICSRLVFDVAIEGSKFTVYVKTQTCKEMEFKVSSNDTFETLRLLIEAKEGILPDQQRLIFDGKQCEDGRTMRDYNIQAGSADDVKQRFMANASPAIEAGVNQISSSTCNKNGAIERGAVCFGEKTTQTFTKCRNFNKSDVDNSLWNFFSIQTCIL